MKRVLYLTGLLFLPFLSTAQLQQLTSGEILAGIQKLGVKGSALYIAAHPDDENTRLLAYLSKELKVRTGYLSLTRGDGGQNLIGNEQAELLGLIRTQELLAARRIDGAMQFFTRANDFGFSKTSDEAFKIWGKEQILADAVWVIRKFRPDVIITRFPEDSRAGHGHHSGSAIIAREAFTAAADPKRFPEQLKYVKVWQAKRILWNTFNFGTTNTTAPDQLKIDVGLYNPLLGRSYGEIAAISRTNHKSQGFGSALQRGEALEYFSPVAGDPAKQSLFDGIEINITDKQVMGLLAGIQKNFRPDAPWLSIPALADLSAKTRLQAFNHELTDELILACAGIWAEATAAEPSYATGDEIPVRIQVIKRAPDAGAQPVHITVASQNASLRPNQMTSLTTVLSAGNTTQPYWLTASHRTGQYSIPSQEDVGFPENRNFPGIKVTFNISGTSIDLVLPVHYKFTDPARGEIYQPLIVAPPVTATMSGKSYIFTGNGSKKIDVQLKSYKDNSYGYVQPELPDGWTSNPSKIDFNLARKGDEQTISFSISPGNKTSGGNILLQVHTGNSVNSGSLKTISYDHIPTITIFPQATARLEKVDVKIAGKHIAYIDGAGDLTAEALKEIGYEVTKLTPAQIMGSDLTGYDAIVTGVRLYNISDEVRLMQPKLLDYVKNGGTLLLQYNVNTNLKIPNLGPYPFKLSTKRVTEEDAKVTFLAPDNPALNYPNKITDADFDGWVQERGIYFGTEIDPEYQQILGMNDTNEPGSPGSLLIADYGKGKYVYTSLVFFRELPAGVPGAYRLIANLLAPKKP